MSICVYKLLCTRNGRFYIGSTVDFRKRKRKHLSDLRNGAHNNIFLQRTFDKYGEDAFKWKGILVDTKEEARELEQHYIDKYMLDKRCMNIGKTASGGDNLTRNPRKRSIVARIKKTLRQRIAHMTEDERKDKWGHPGATNGMHGRTHTPEARAKMSAANKGRVHLHRRGVPLSEETRRKLRESRLGRFTGADNPFYGRTHSDKVKAALSSKAKERHANGFRPSNVRRVRPGNSRRGPDRPRCTTLCGRQRIRLPAGFRGWRRN